jgi:hypothetical protein
LQANARGKGDEMGKKKAAKRAALRDALLPTLLSGEIRVVDAERTVETVI